MMGKSFELDWQEDFSLETGPTLVCPMCGGDAMEYGSDFRGPYPDRMHKECMECGFHVVAPA